MTTMMQSTFGTLVGMKPAVAIAPHPTDYVDLEDTGGYARRCDCYESADGKFWQDWEERDDHETCIVEDLLESIIEGDDDYLISSDCMDGYASCLSYDSEWMRDHVKEWIRDNCEGGDDPDKSTLQAIVDDLKEVANGEANYSDWINSSEHEFVLGSVEIGEHEIQVYVDCYPIFEALVARSDLEDLLHASNYLGPNERAVWEDGQIIGRERQPYVSGGSFHLMNDSGIHHWWGCTNQQVWEACNKNIDELEYVGFDSLEV